jgi:hypothetical protein
MTEIVNLMDITDRTYAFDSKNVSEMRLAAQLIHKTTDNSITLFDKGIYSLGLLHHWQTSGEKRNWLLPLKKNTQYEVGRRDVLVYLKTSPQARKQRSALPDEVVARLQDGQERQVLTSLTDQHSCPGNGN